MPFGMSVMGPKKTCIAASLDGQFWGWKVAGPWHARTCPAVDILKATQKGAEPVRCGYRLGSTSWGCTLATPSEYDTCTATMRPEGHIAAVHSFEKRTAKYLVDASWTLVASYIDKQYSRWWINSLKISLREVSKVTLCVTVIGYWTTRGYANSRIANSRTGRLDISRTGQLAD